MSAKRNSIADGCKSPAPRQLRPRDPIATAPTHVSQINCLQIAGIDPRRFLDLLGEYPAVPRAAVGRLRVVSVDDLRALLARLATDNDDAASARAADNDEPITPESVLARIGMKRCAS